MILNNIPIILLFLIGFNFASNCTDFNACNYNPDAILDDGSCYYPINDCDIDNCCPPDGFGFNNQINFLNIFIDSAYKFLDPYSSETHLHLDEYEDWIGGFKLHDETQDGACIFPSNNCPDIMTGSFLKIA